MCHKQNLICFDFGLVKSIIHVNLPQDELAREYGEVRISNPAENVFVYEASLDIPENLYEYFDAKLSRIIPRKYYGFVIIANNRVTIGGETDILYLGFDEPFDFATI